MSAYNRINGTFASSHSQLLTDILKDEWGFDGVVVSDWGACLETVKNANGGLDLEMPGPATTMGTKLLEAIQDGLVDEKTIDDKVRRLLRLVIQSGKMDSPYDTPEAALDTPETRELARETAADAIVLLKNNRILPFDAGGLKRIAVIGPNAEHGQIQGGGSSGVAPHYQVHPLEGIKNCLGDSAEVVHEKGCLTHKYAPPIHQACLKARDSGQGGLLAEYYKKTNFSGPPDETDIENRAKISWFGAFGGDIGSVVSGREFCVRLTGTFTPKDSGTYTFGLMSAGRSRMLLDGKIIIDNWTDQTRGDCFYGFGSTEKRAAASLEAERPCELSIEYLKDETAFIAGLQYGVIPPFPSDALARAVETAGKADAVVLVVGTNGDWETEGNDRASMSLPGSQDELIEKVCSVNPNTVVVLNTGSPVLMPWFEKAPSILQCWFPGQEFGNAIADIIFGRVNPSGKMPTTIPYRLEDTPSFTTYPGENHQVLYGEDIFAGYRWYDKRDIAPRIPFGHGLSYTSFKYSGLKVAPRQKPGDPIRVQIDITNTGDRSGKEVVQIYVRDKVSRLVRPEKELKAFKKISLSPGETRQVDLMLDDRSLSYWDPRARGWVAEPGEFEILAGSSSRDIRSAATFTLG